MSGAFLRNLKCAVVVTVLLTGSACTLSSDHEDQSESSALKSLCQSNLQSVFEQAYYRPLLTDPALCLNCHNDTGPSPYKFASSDIKRAFNTFMQLGADHVDAVS